MKLDAAAAAGLGLELDTVTVTAGHWHINFTELDSITIMWSPKASWV
jgi:hypothetical protein